VVRSTVWRFVFHFSIFKLPNDHHNIASLARERAVAKFDAECTESIYSREGHRERKRVRKIYVDRC
jgi:hypothetical protein